MNPRLHIVTLGVRDVSRAVSFYRDGLGWKPAVELDDFILFDLGGVALALYPRDLLAADAGVAAGHEGFGGVTLAQNVSSRREVDDVLAHACRVGGRLLQAASEKEWGGYSGYFADPDGHAWEIAYNPHFALGADGRLTW